MAQGLKPYKRPACSDAPTTVSVVVQPGGAPSSSSSDSELTASSSGHTSSSVSTSGSQSWSSSSESSTESGDFCDREEMLDQLDDLDKRLDQVRAEAEERATLLMPEPTMCNTVADLVVAWNDMLSVMLRTMKAPAHKVVLSDSEAQPEEGTEEDVEQEEEPLVLLRVTANPAGPDESGAFKDAKAACVPFAKAKAQCQAIIESHDLLLECQDAEDEVTRDKFNGDTKALRNALNQLKQHRADTVSEQTTQVDALRNSLALLRAKMPKRTYGAESLELASIVQELPTWVPQRELWLQQSKRGSSEREIIVVTDTILALSQRLPEGEWRELIEEVQRELAESDQMTPTVAAKMERLEASAGALHMPDKLVRRTRQLQARVREEAAQRTERRAELENEMYVIRTVRGDRVRELHAEFFAIQTRLVEACVQVITRNQNVWRLALSKLNNDAVHPLLEQAMPVDEALLPERAIKAYRTLRLASERDLESQRLAKLETLVDDTLERVPDLQELRAEFVAQGEDVLPDVPADEDSACARRT